MPRDAAPQVELDLVACMGRIAGGDRAAFKALYDATSSRLFAIALLLMRRRDAAEDVLQEVYLRVWSRAGLYDPVKGPPMPWLARITRNAAISRIVQNRVPHEDIDDHAEELVAQVASAAENMDLARCLKHLSADHKRAVISTFLYGYTHEELAAALGVPLGTAKSWTRRGAERLKLCLEA